MKFKLPEIYEVQLIRFMVHNCVLQHNVELFRSSGVILLAQYYSSLCVAPYSYIVPYVRTSLSQNTCLFKCTVM